MVKLADTIGLDSQKDEYRPLFTIMREGLCIIDKEGNFVFANHRMEEMLGYTGNEILGKPFLSFFAGEGVAAARDFLERCRQSPLQGADLKFLRRDGNTIDATLNSMPIWDNDGAYEGTVASLWNITESKRMQLELNQNEQRYRDFADGLPQAVFETDALGNITFCNHNASIAYGYTEEDINSGLNLLQMVVPEQRKRVRRRVLLALGGQRTRPVEYTALRKDGTTFPILVHTNAIFQGGQPAGLRGIAMDISESKRISEALQASEEKLRRVFDSFYEGIIVTDMDGTVTDVNQKALQIRSFASKNDIVGKKALDFMSPADRDRARAQTSAALAGATVGPLRYTLLKADGSEFPGELTRSALRNASGNPIGFISVVKDNSTRDRLRHQLQLYISGITSAQEEERRRIARDLHDDVAQSLASLLLDIETIGRSAKCSPDSVPKLLRQLRAKVNSILEGVRRFSHELRPEILDQLGLLPALESLAAELDPAETTVRVKVTGSTVRVPPREALLLFRIAQEALHNVKKHARATEAVVKVTFTKHKVKLTITDNGCGFQTPKEMEALVAGGRLGLIGMRERAQMLGGTFSIQSRPGKGTVVEVEVPR